MSVVVVVVLNFFPGTKHQGPIVPKTVIRRPSRAEEQIPHRRETVCSLLKPKFRPFFFSLARDSTHYRTQAKVKVVLFDKYQHSNALLLLWTITTKNKRKTTLAHFALCL